MCPTRHAPARAGAEELDAPVDSPGATPVDMSGMAGPTQASQGCLGFAKKRSAEHPARILSSKQGTRHCQESIQSSADCVAHGLRGMHTALSAAVEHLKRTWLQLPELSLCVRSDASSYHTQLHAAAQCGSMPCVFVHGICMQALTSL